MNKLYRDTENEKVMGVLAGLSEYLDVSVTVLRTIYLVLVVLDPAKFILLYGLLCLIVNEKDDVEGTPSSYLEDTEEEEEDNNLEITVELDNTELELTDIEVEVEDEQDNKDGEDVEVDEGKELKEEDDKDSDTEEGQEYELGAGDIIGNYYEEE